MKRVGPALASLLLIAGGSSARAEGEHRPLAREVERGDLIPLAALLERLGRRLPGYRHIGSEYDPRNRRYRLKYIALGRVVWVDVDARSGAVLGMASP